MEQLTARTDSKPKRIPWIASESNIVNPFVSAQTRFNVCRLVKSKASGACEGFFVPRSKGSVLVKSLPHQMEMTMASQIQFSVVANNLFYDI
jgi:hypothetical protein